MKLFVVYHTLALESKRIVFINEYKSAMISLSKGIENKLTYLSNTLNCSILHIDEVLKA